MFTSCLVQTANTGMCLNLFPNLSSTVLPKPKKTQTIVTKHPTLTRQTLCSVQDLQIKCSDLLDIIGLSLPKP